MDWPSVSVVMVTYHTGPLLPQAIAAALAAPDVGQLVLVNNGNPKLMERRLRTLAAARDDIVLIEGQGNIGFARASNLGARAAAGEYLLFLNPDTVLEPGAAARMAAAGAGAPAPWATGARLINLDGSEQRGARRGALTPGSALVSFFGLHRLARIAPALRNVHREREPLPASPAPTPVVSGAALLMRAVDFAALGGFDEAYFLHVEDIDLCRRIGEAGGAVMFAPEARVMHHGSTSNVSLLVVEWAKARGLVRYFWKFARGFRGKTEAAIVAPLVFGAILGRVLLHALRRRVDFPPRQRPPAQPVPGASTIRSTASPLE